MKKLKIAFFDAKPYDKPSFDKYGEAHGVCFKYYETKLNEDTAKLAAGSDGVCVFVNDTVDAAVIDRLVEMDIKILALRCAGFNNIDMKHAHGRIHVLRVPAYSPYAVAEHTMALLLTSIRRIHKAYIRSRDFNFSLSGLTGFDQFVTERGTKLTELVFKESHSFFGIFEGRFQVRGLYLGFTSIIFESFSLSSYALLRIFNLTTPFGLRLKTRSHCIFCLLFPKRNQSSGNALFFSNILNGAFSGKHQFDDCQFFFRRI